MGTYVKGVLTERIKRTATVESFRFSSAKRPVFLPGQFMKVIFDEKEEGNKELNKYLSFSSSPLRDYFEVTKRISASRFSAALTALKPGDELAFQMPMGSCVFSADIRKISFLVGGIGITPVVAMLEYADAMGLNTDISLFYSNRTEDEIAFRAEIDRWQSINKNLKVFYTITSCAPQDSRCFSGTITRELVLEHIPDFKERVFFIFGPPAMVKAMQELCSSLGCSRENVKAENFLGY